MYEPPGGEEPAGCRDTLAITRAMFGVLLPPLIAIMCVVAAVAAAVVLFAVHPALSLLPLAALAVGVALFARWERRHFRPPGL